MPLKRAVVTKISPDELRPYLGFKTGNYSRHRVMKNEFVEMLVLCWKPGQATRAEGGRVCAEAGPIPG